MGQYRKRRIAADEAHSWARDLKLRNPHAKSLLRAVALYVNSEGVAWVGVDDLASDCDLSPNTIRSRLRFLEEVGAIARFSVWIDEQGRRNREGRGKRTTDDIKILIDADPDMIEAAAASRGEPPADESSPAQAEPLENTSGPVSPSVALQQPFSSVEVLNPSNDELKKDSPQKPPERSGGLSSEPTDQAESESGADPPGLAEFTAAYPIPSNKPAQVRALWLALDAEGRARNIRGAIGARRYRETTKPKSSLPAPEQFVRNGAAEAYLAHAPDPSPQAPQGPQWVLIDSLEGRALSTLHRIARAPQPLSHARPSGEFFLLKIPLDARGLKCGEAPDPRQWLAPSTVAQTQAWREFLQAAIGRAPGGDFTIPWPFPPRKDGTLSQAPPDQIPGTLMTESDAQELDKTGD